MLTADSSRARISGARWISFSITAHRDTIHIKQRFASPNALGSRHSPASYVRYYWRAEAVFYIIRFCVRASLRISVSVTHFSVRAKTMMHQDP
jgi:hypothetical protein